MRCVALGSSPRWDVFCFERPSLLSESGYHGMRGEQREKSSKTYLERKIPKNFCIATSAECWRSAFAHSFFSSCLVVVRDLEIGFGSILPLLFSVFFLSFHFAWARRKMCARQF